MKPTFSSIALKCKPIIYFLFKFQFNTTTYIVENKERFDNASSFIEFDNFSNFEKARKVFN